MKSNSKNYIISSVSLRIISIIFLISGLFVFLTTKDLRPESINNHIDYNIVTDLLVKLISISNILRASPLGVLPPDSPHLILS